MTESALQTAISPCAAANGKRKTMAVCTYGAVTDKGDRRPENQDSILCLTDREIKSGLFLVADGMGGLSRGGQVSRYIAERFARWWREDFPDIIRSGQIRREDMREFLEQEIWDINQELLCFRRQDGCRCGSTLSLLLIHEGHYYIENMGDSRIYLFCRGKLQQLTEDQSLAAQLKREGQLTGQERSAVGKNVLTMCLGMFEIPQSYFRDGDLEGEERFLLCSDGLSNQVSAAQMARILNRRELLPQELAGILRSSVLPGMAADNISIIVAEILG